MHLCFRVVYFSLPSRIFSVPDVTLHFRRFHNSLSFLTSELFCHGYSCQKKASFGLQRSIIIRKRYLSIMHCAALPACPSDYKIWVLFLCQCSFCMAAQNTADATVKFIFVSSVQVSINFSNFVSGIFVECRIQILQLIFLKIWCRYWSME